MIRATIVNSEAQNRRENAIRVSFVNAKSRIHDHLRVFMWLITCSSVVISVPLVIIAQQVQLTKFHALKAPTLTQRALLCAISVLRGTIVLKQHRII